MKKEFLYVLPLALAGALMASCSNEEDVKMPEVPQVSNSGFAAISYAAGQQLIDGSRADVRPSALNVRRGSGTSYSRGTEISGSNYLDNTLVPDMKVWAFFTPTVTEEDGILQGAQYVGAGGNGIVIDNNSTTSPAASLWDYHTSSDLAYWPKADLNFYAIAPASDASFSVAATVNNKMAHVVAAVVVPVNVEDQKDIMFAANDGANAESPRTAGANNPVQFSFAHALSQVVFQGKCYSGNISVALNDIKVCNVDQEGSVGFTTDDGSAVTLGSALAANRVYAKYSAGLAYDYDDVNSTYFDYVSLGADEVATPKYITATNGALFMLPQNREDEAWETVPGTPVTVAEADAAHQTYLAVTCKVKNGAVYLIGDDDNYETIYIPFDINWEQGKKYVYTIVFGKGSGAYDEDGLPLDSMLPITYTVQAISDWTDAATDNVEF